jgi:hypothetical protein
MERVQNIQVKHIAGEENAEKAKKLLKENYFFVGLTEQFHDSLKLFKAIGPQSLNIDYKKKVVARENRIKNEILNSPEKLELARKYNKHDIELYNYVKDELFPEAMKEMEARIKQIPEPQNRYNSVLTWNYQISLFYNKFIYKILLKLLGKRK